MRKPVRNVFVGLIICVTILFPVYSCAMAGVGELVGVAIFPFFPNSKLFTLHSEQSSYWYYTPLSYSTKTLPTDPTANIQPFIDQREERHSNMLYMAEIPLLPYGTISSTKPEKSDKHLNTSEWNFDPVNNFPRALLTELEEAQIFSHVTFGEKASADLEITGEITRTTYQGKIYSYGLSTVGKIF